MERASVVGWDIGAVNLKAVLWAMDEKKIPKLRVASRAFEIWRDIDHFSEILQSVWKSVTSESSPRAMAVTMTAELSDAFGTKREGVLFVLQTLQACFPLIPTYIFSLNGDFFLLNEACTHPLDFAASNWLASGEWVARQNPNCLLIDIGTTTTDILPIVDRKVRVLGRNDTERLSCGELVYTGVLRTNLAAIVQTIPVAGRFCRVASEYFAISGDVHLILGDLDPRDYSCRTPDGKDVSADGARKRLARVVCADTEMLSTEEIEGMAQYIRGQQILQICTGLEQVLSRFPCLRRQPVIVLGSGAFLGVAAAKSLGLDVGTMRDRVEHKALAVAPCLAVAQLLAEHLGVGSQ